VSEIVVEMSSKISVGSKAAPPYKFISRCPRWPLWLWFSAWAGRSIFSTGI